MVLQPTERESGTGLVQGAIDERLKRLVDDYFYHYRGSTLDTYRKALKQFALFLGLHPDNATGIAGTLISAGQGETTALVLRFLDTLKDRNRSQSTCNTYLAAIKALVGLAKMVGIISWTIEIKGKRAETYRDTRGPGIEGVRLMLNGLEGRKDAKNIRDYAIIRLLWGLGLRRGAVARLDYEDVDIDTGALMVLEKGRTGKEPRTLPVGVKDALTAWISIRGNNPGPLFHRLDRAGNGDGRLTTTAIGNLVREAGESVGINGVHPHGIRHSAITHSLDRMNGNIRAVSRFSGHRDVRILSVYDDN